MKISAAPRVRLYALRPRPAALMRNGTPGLPRLGGCETTWPLSLGRDPGVVSAAQIWAAWF